MNEKSSSDGVRKPVLIVIVAVAVLAGGLVLMKMRGSKSAPPPETASEAAPIQAKKTKPETPAEPASPSEAAKPAPPPATPAPAPTSSQTAAASAVPAGTIPRGPEPTPETRRLVSTLVNIDLNPAALTPETATAWKQNLQALIQNGAAAVPAIQEYLALNKDVNFESVPGAANLFGSSSLRLSLLDALGNIGGPEAIALSAQALQSTLDPREIALLANNLEKQAPEQYRDAALAAARAALAQASAGNLSGRDVGPLFGVLTQFGGAAAVGDLQQAAAGQWRYYATIAMAQMPDGSGLPALIQMATDPNNPAASGRTAALQVLGQVAADNPDARNALLDQARRGAIPSATWINIAAALGGDRFQIGAIDAQSTPNVRTWHLNFGNQNYYAAPMPLTQDQINQRLGIIDQFIAANPGEFAAAALQDARSKLQGRIVVPGSTQ
jgi:hypothetical protein